MKYRPAFGPTLQQIHDALVKGFQDVRLQSGAFLTATNTNNSTPSGGTYPFLAFRTGSFRLSPWKDFQWSISWDIPATLTVQGPGEDGEIQARLVLNDLIERTMELVGLPIDDKGQVVPLNDDTIRLFDDGKLTFLCERGAPYLTSAVVRAVDDGLCRVDIVFHIESTLSLDRRELNRMKVGVLGIVPVAPGDVQTTSESGITLVARTGYASADPSFPSTVYNSNQEQGPANVVASPPLNQQTASVNVTPYSVALSAGTPTATVAAIAFAVDASSQYVTNTGTWSTSNAAVATVSNGVITRIAAGSCTVSCTYGGVVSNAVAVTST